ncbi:MAG: TIGR04133 family radical SAM/SPASM protein [Bacteroidaceae bacterium]|nr:TIGR04133 family radical SAM/SPASM protein [Bacteroidaceae bacterium]
MVKPLPLSLRKKVALELWRHREQNMLQEHPLQQLFWECTLRCNLRCRHCGSDCTQKSEQLDMPKEDFLRVLDSIAAKTDPHQVFVIISGGEPLMRDDLEACCAAIHAKGFPWGMVTNGLFLTRDRFVNLLKAGMGSLTISLDGLEDDHNWMRGNPHSFQKVDYVLSMLAKMPQLMSDVVTCVTRRNYSKLPEIRQYLLSKGVPRWRIFTVFPVGRAATDPELRLSDEEFRSVFEFIRTTRKEKQIHLEYGCEGFLGNYEGEVRDHLYTCQAGITIGSVLVDGSISACTSIRSDYHQGNIYRDDFMDVWEHRFQPYRNHDWMRTGECHDCTLFRYCQGNGMHLRDSEGHLLLCHVHRLSSG